MRGTERREGKERTDRKGREAKERREWIKGQEGKGRTLEKAKKGNARK